MKKQEDPIMAQFLDYEERIHLIVMISKLHQFTEPRNRRTFIENAGLDRFVPHLALAGAPSTVATELVNLLERSGELPEKPMYHALGALLRPILDMETEVSQADRSFAAKLILRHLLIKDLEFITKLRNQYNLTDLVERKLAPEEHVFSPIKRDEIPPNPKFEMTIDDETALESVINSKDNFLDIHLMYGVVYCHQAVGSIEIPRGTAKGTGFMVGPDLMLTNQHVIPKKEYLKDAVIQFDYLQDSFNTQSKGKQIRFQTDFYESSPETELDYALVRLAECPLKDKSKDYDSLEVKTMQNLVHKGIHRGYLTLTAYDIKKGEPVYIIQHPKGDPMKVVMTQNLVEKDAMASRVNYVADTMDGSSGSPVFNKHWQVVALHHSGGPYPPPEQSAVEKVKGLWKDKWRYNQGIPMKAILEDFEKKKISLPG